MNEPPLKIVFVISPDCPADRKHPFAARLLRRAGRRGGGRSRLPVRLLYRTADSDRSAAECVCFSESVRLQPKGITECVFLGLARQTRLESGGG